MQGPCGGRLRTPCTVCGAVALLVLLAGGAAWPLSSLQPDGQAASDLESLVSHNSVLLETRGYASHYSRRFKGRKTSSGSRYRPEAMTAAHPVYPLGTVVKVVNPLTGQDVLVTVNDRCAKRPYPFIDLSQAAARRIGLLGRGRIQVDIIPLADGWPEQAE